MCDCVWHMRTSPIGNRESPFGGSICSKSSSAEEAFPGTLRIHANPKQPEAAPRYTLYHVPMPVSLFLAAARVGELRPDQSRSTLDGGIRMEIRLHCFVARVTQIFHCNQLLTLHRAFGTQVVVKVPSTAGSSSAVLRITCQLHCSAKAVSFHSPPTLP